MQLWGVEIEYVNDDEQRYLGTLPHKVPTVEWLWMEMDRIWVEIGLNNRKPLSCQNIGVFYSHPVWIANGVFTMVDELSKQHRHAVADCLKELGISKVADYGGGFGELAVTISRELPTTSIEIVEPYPSAVGLKRIEEHNQITLISELNKARYHALIAQDVLEHVEAPIDLAYELAESVCLKGYLLFLNCFFPVIKCHLPATFHLRYNFRYVMQAMGLEYVGKIKGTEHGLIFKKVRGMSLLRARRAELLSRLAGPLENCLFPFLSKAKKHYERFLTKEDITRLIF